MGLTTVLALAVFAFPVAVWLGYSEEIASAGGLYSFVEAAAGRRVARVQGAVWTVSYFLYIPYTVTYVVYDVLPVVFPGIGPYRSTLELLLPLGVVAAVLAPLRGLLIALLVGGVAQLGLMLAVGGLELANLGAPARSFAAHGGASAVGNGTANVSLLLICGSLPLFLGGEVRGGGKTVRRGLVAAFAIVGAYLLFAAFPLADLPPHLRASEIPGYAIASAYSIRPVAILVGLGTAVSVAGLIVAEYVALSRLLHAMTGAVVKTSLLWIAVPFLLADALSLVDPERFYDELLKPSLVALYVSQVIVFAVYPLFRRRRSRLLPFDLFASAVASALMGYGLYAVATTQLGLGS